MCSPRKRFTYPGLKSRFWTFLYYRYLAMSQEFNNEDQGSISEVIVVTSTNSDQMLFEIEETNKKKAKISDDKMFEDFFLD